jgi:hypothetical protein
MSTNLRRLKVSLTKHGAHKIAYLISKFDKDEILENTWESYQNIRIDRAQASKILSASRSGEVPSIWNEIKKYGEQDIFDIVFIANVFSHFDLINTMISAIDDDCVVKNGTVIGGKAYTNFAHTIDQFGYSIEHTPDYISFDISRIFYKFYLTKHIAEILQIKLIDAGWDQKNDFIEECISKNFNKVFGLTKSDFNNWLENEVEVEERKIVKVKAKRNFKNGIKFSAGHSSKYEGEVTAKSTEKHTITLTHNRIQNRVFNILKAKHPSDEIGTEIASNIGSVDIVRKQNDYFHFYEIKTTDNTKSNIRQALSQLLEYAYWNDIHNIKSLIIIAPSKTTKDSINYLNLLRKRFGIPIYYQYYDIDKNILGEIE